MTYWKLVLSAAPLLLAAQQPRSADAISAGRKEFAARCAGCHGADGTGGERAPSIGRSDREKYQSARAIRDLIRRGIPDAGMPAFEIPEPQFTDLVAFVRSRFAPAQQAQAPGNAAAGEAFFFGKGRCSACHMVMGRGGLDGPDLTETGRELTLAEIEQALRDPNGRRKPDYIVAEVRLKSGGEVRGFVRNESNADLQLQGFDHRLYLLRRDDVASISREAGS